MTLRFLYSSFGCEENVRQKFAHTFASAQTKLNVMLAVRSLRVRVDIIGHARIKYVVKYQSCMVAPVIRKWVRCLNVYV